MITDMDTAVIYRVKLGTFVVLVAMPDSTGNGLIDVARVALAQAKRGPSDSDAMRNWADDNAAYQGVTSVEHVGTAYLDARVK